MNVWCPSLRHQRHLLPQLPDRDIERVRDGIGVNRLVRQQLVVEPLRHIWPIDVAHRPGVLSSVADLACLNKHRLTTLSLLRS
jgi:hypothetical protein